MQHQGLLPQPQRGQDARAVRGAAEKLPGRPDPLAAGAGDDGPGVQKAEPGARAGREATEAAVSRTEKEAGYAGAALCLRGN
ncbi:hypothetical protein ACFSKU_06795 [Pontibacter silvestris]|uniref:Uncharacterized protein n=1 Tax=Pontibacter silvestris TaxID=2305183 RepID=A0ABW4WUZ7_9BACT